MLQIKNIAGLGELDEVQLPDTFDRSHLQMQLSLLGDSTDGRKFNSVPEVAKFISALHPQTRMMFKEVEAFVELCVFPYRLPHQKDHSQRSGDSKPGCEIP